MKPAHAKSWLATTSPIPSSPCLSWVISTRRTATPPWPSMNWRGRKARSVRRFGTPAQRELALKTVAAYPRDDWAPSALLVLGEPAHSLALFETGKSGLSDGYLNYLWQHEVWSRKARQDPAFQGFAQRIGMLAYWKRNGWPDLCKPEPAKGPDAFVCR